MYYEITVILFNDLVKKYIAEKEEFQSMIKRYCHRKNVKRWFYDIKYDY